MTNAAISHHKAELDELRSDPELAAEYLKSTMASLDDPNDRAAGLLALRTIAEAYGDSPSNPKTVQPEPGTRKPCK